MTLDVGAHSAASRDDVAIYPYVACAPINSPIFIAYFSSHFPPSLVPVPQQTLAFTMEL